MHTQTLPSAHLQAEVIRAEGIAFHDYLLQFSGQRTEWVAGTVIEHMPNNRQHQLILLFLARLLADFLDLRPLGVVYPAGYPMYIRDDQPAREPDFLVVLAEHTDRIKETHLAGIADVVFEIVSPGSTLRDRGIKFAEYEQLGIPEYWLIDPLRSDVGLYVLDEDGHYQRMQPNAQNKLNSSILIGFAIEPDIFLREPLPDKQGIERLLKDMLAD